MGRKKGGKPKASPARGKQSAEKRLKGNDDSPEGQNSASSIDDAGKRVADSTETDHTGGADDANDVTDLNSEKSDESSEDEAEAKKQRHKRPRRSEWALALIQAFVGEVGAKVKDALQSDPPDLTAVESLLSGLNKDIQSANHANQAHLTDGLLMVNMYRHTYDGWAAKIGMADVQDNAEKGWRAYDATLELLRVFNRENGLPIDWVFSPAATQTMFGERPPSVIEPSPDLEMDSAVEYESESESESESEAGIDGIDALEKRMRKEYSSLSRGKVLYWWPVGTGTQIFVRYGSKRKAIYRVRAGSSMPYSEHDTELVLGQTRGNKKMIIKDDRGSIREAWEYTRNQVDDIVGVGWKIEDDDEAGVNALELIRPRKCAMYPHTRVVVKWKDGQTSLERRGFVRRIANGTSLNGDRMIYLKAREMEKTYWGDEFDGETEESDSGNETETTQSTKRSRHLRHRSRPSRRHWQDSDSSESDADSETSESSLESKPRRSRRHKVSNANKHRAGKKSRRSGQEDRQIRMLQDLLEQLTTKRNSDRPSERSRRSRGVRRSNKP
ncbi:uncharacterized protein CDV56_103023 [Aspergillus thermomutatus]|uniref:Uncharacterized protein n=1 Tax=Aspergillus thermomutatus TaxID=41047 RepID=A0A397GGG4_ASPTH|nr:uncharacterized protein CDV56_103023 [Aspergillus thermomutatus]RHZ48748.1 hypothetical protein CDV56_103023 [Aspergillus thermomutatus]